MFIFVKLQTGKSISVDVSPDDSIADVKVKINLKEGIPVATQAIVYCGSVLPDDATVMESFPKEATVHVINRPAPTPAPAEEFVEEDGLCGLFDDAPAGMACAEADDVPAGMACAEAAEEEGGHGGDADPFGLFGDTPGWSDESDSPPGSSAGGIFDPQPTAAGKAPEKAIQVFVKTLTGKVIPLSLYPSDCVGDIKERIYDKEGIPYASQRLVFNKKQLEDSQSIEDAGIAMEAMIMLIVAQKRVDAAKPKTSPKAKKKNERVVFSVPPEEKMGLMWWLFSVAVRALARCLASLHVRLHDAWNSRLLRHLWDLAEGALAIVRSVVERTRGPCHDAAAVLRNAWNAYVHPVLAWTWRNGHFIVVDCAGEPLRRLCVRINHDAVVVVDSVYERACSFVGEALSLVWRVRDGIVSVARWCKDTVVVWLYMPIRDALRYLVVDLVGGFTRWFGRQVGDACRAVGRGARYVGDGLSVLAARIRSGLYGYCLVPCRDLVRFCFEHFVDAGSGSVRQMGRTARACASRTSACARYLWRAVLDPACTHAWRGVRFLAVDCLYNPGRYVTVDCLFHPARNGGRALLRGTRWISTSIDRGAQHVLIDLALPACRTTWRGARYVLVDCAMTPTRNFLASSYTGMRDTAGRGVQWSADCVVEGASLARRGAQWTGRTSRYLLADCIYAPSRSAMRFVVVDVVGGCARWARGQVLGGARLLGRGARYLGRELAWPLIERAYQAGRYLTVDMMYTPVRDVSVRLLAATKRAARYVVWDLMGASARWCSDRAADTAWPAGRRAGRALRTVVVDYALTPMRSVVSSFNDAVERIVRYIAFDVVGQAVRWCRETVSAGAEAAGSRISAVLDALAVRLGQVVDWLASLLSVVHERTLSPLLVFARQCFLSLRDQTGRAARAVSNVMSTWLLAPLRTATRTFHLGATGEMHRIGNALRLLQSFFSNILWRLTKPFRARGLHSRGFSVDVPLGDFDEDTGTVRLSGDTEFAIRVANKTQHACELVLQVDTLEIGRFNLFAGRSYTIERPGSTNRRLTFARGVNDARNTTSTIVATFIPQAGLAPPPPVTPAGPPADPVGTRPVTMRPGGPAPSAPPAGAAEPPPQPRPQPGTALGGLSSQHVSRMEGLLVVDEAAAVVLRLPIVGVSN